MPTTTIDAPTTGHLFGVGVGPGDPDLLTIKARRTIETCPVVAHFAAARRPGNAWTTIEALVTADHAVLRLEYPSTTEAVEPDDYERAMRLFYDDAAGVIATCLDRGDDVAVVCEGDPFFYGSYMYLHCRLADRYPTTVVPGVTSVSAACAASGTPLVSLHETLTVLPGVLPAEALKEALAAADAAVVMKVGRRLDDVREAVDAVGRADDALYVERASCTQERVLPLGETEDVEGPYFSLVLVPGEGIRRR